MKPKAPFWSCVAVGAPDECWPWLRSLIDGRYGQCDKSWDAGRRAHRAAWALANGPVPAGLWVLHKCDNPPCCNPGHLFLGTPQDNTLDAVAKGRKVLAPMLGKKMSALAKARCRAKQLGVRHTEASKAKLSAAHLGRVKSAAECAAISAGLRGLPKSEAHKAALRKPKSEAHKAALRQAAKARPWQVQSTVRQFAFGDTPC